GESGKSMARVPKGFGSHDGYDDASSIMAGWQFGKEPTMALIGIRPDQTGYGDMGDQVTYTLTILNQPLDDLISLTFETSRPWGVHLLTANGLPLPDTNSDGLPDTGQLPASSSYNFKVKVVIPAQPPIGNEMIADIYASSTVNKAKDFTTIATQTRPHLEPMKSANPEEIYLEGVGTSEVTEITLEVFGGGYILTERQPQDTILIIDSSGSMQTSDPNNLRLEAAKRYVDNMSAPDRGAVVDFDYTAELAPRGNGDHLSSDYAKIKQNIDTIDSNGGTNVGAGIEVANNELLSNGDPSHLWVEILLSDACEPDTYYPVTSQQIQNATDAHIIIFTIGLGLAEEINEDLLKEIADRTGGDYYLAENAEALLEIYSKIEMVISDIAGRDGDLTDADRMIRDVIPPYIHPIYGSFSIRPDAIYYTADGTFFEWNVARIRVGQSWKVSYQVTSSKLGWVPVGIYPEARVSYIRWNNEHASHSFPDVKVHVILPPSGSPTGPPKNLRTSVENGVDIRLDWNPPDEPTVSHYLIYRSEDQRDFDFVNPVHDTSNDLNPTRTAWLDASAADVGVPRDYYYVVRVVNTNGSMSTTSNTAGKWTRTFEVGLNSFSLPLEPFSPVNVSDLANDIPNAEFIRTIKSDGEWETHVAGIKGAINDDEALVGKGYEISLSTQTTYTFVGFPASMISYREGLGESITFRTGLTADVLGSDIHITWQLTPSASEYEIFRSTTRDGLFDEVRQPVATVSASTNSYTDGGVALPGTEHYYWILPIDSNRERGSSTYSVGVWIGVYQKGADTISSPLKLATQIWIDELCELDDNIAGIAYLTEGIWKFHAREMPSSVYDTIFEQSMGYQMSTEEDIQLVFIGY
ncbi:MAG: VWA domain-containing protein, partial [Thermoplasmata archaeon]|nr:VWA domain-containing protein [Thermoplasmata archaeon]